MDGLHTTDRLQMILFMLLWTKKRAEGKPYYVYRLTAGANKFLRNLLRPRKKSI